jgi:taurine dioxygenase
MITVDRCGTALGAEISGADLSAQLSTQDRDAILRAFLDHKVLFFRDQHLQDDALVAFARLFGDLAAHFSAPTLAGGLADIQIVDSSDFRPRGYRVDAWHSDASFEPEPFKGAVLKAVVLPPLGGDTLWSNLAAAYESLPDRIQHLIGGLEAAHEYPFPARDGGPANKRAVHPVVRVHPETGEKSLFVNELFTRQVLGFRPSESQHLLNLLVDAIRVPETQVRFRWRVGSIAVWDNRCTAHYGAGDYTAKRVMHRVTFAGERPIAARQPEA